MVASDDDAVLGYHIHILIYIVNNDLVFAISYAKEEEKVHERTDGASSRRSVFSNTTY